MVYDVVVVQFLLAQFFVPSWVVARLWSSTVSQSLLKFTTEDTVGGSNKQVKRRAVFWLVGLGKA